MIDPRIDKRLLTVTELAKYMGLAKSTIYAGICPGSKKKFPIQPKRINGSIRFCKRKVDEFIDKI